MKILTITASAIAIVTALALDPPASDFQKTAAGYRLSWEGKVGETYFLQYSTDLIEWGYFPEIEHGIGNYEYNFNSTEPKLFVRVASTDMPTTDPENADFDGDGLGNLAELTGTPNTDPFKLDTDGNGVSDGGLIDDDGDGIPTAYEIANSLDPLVANGPSDLAAYLATLATSFSTLEVFTHLK